MFIASAHYIGFVMKSLIGDCLKNQVNSTKKKLKNPLVQFKLILKNIFSIHLLYCLHFATIKLFVIKKNFMTQQEK